MPFEIESTYFDGAVKVIVPKTFPDERGYFMELYRQDTFAALGITEPFLQDNFSSSKYGVIRGLHFQWEKPMAKLMRVTRGKAFMVAVDIRKNSPTLGEWVGIEISEEDKRYVWAPASFARGFCALSAVTEVQYKCTAIYNPACEESVVWNDPDIGIEWPVEEPTLSPKDADAQSLSDWLAREPSDRFTL